MNRVVVIDYGMGNLRSVVKALEHVAAEHTHVALTASPKDILEADRVVFPGQGAARDCMQALRDSGVLAALRQVATDRPFLGICMGMQVLLDHSEENAGTDCLGLVSGRVTRFAMQQPAADDGRLKIPHMGWNQIRQTLSHPLWHGIAQDSHFYFVHSYYVQPESTETVAGMTDYGIRFCSAMACGNVFALQSHPEKSAAPGLRLLQNFMSWKGDC